MERFLLLILSANVLINITFAQTNRAKNYYAEAKAIYEQYSTRHNKPHISVALEKINKAIQISPEYKEAYLLQSMIYVRMDSCDKALYSINISLQLDSSYAEGYRERGYIKKMDCFNDMQGAFDDYDIAIKLNPNFIKAYIGRAQALERLCIERTIPANDSTYNLILKDYDRAIELDPGNIIAYTNRASFKYKTLKDADGACKDWKKLRELGWDVDYELYKYCKWDGR